MRFGGKKIFLARTRAAILVLLGAASKSVANGDSGSIASEVPSHELSHPHANDDLIPVMRQRSGTIRRTILWFLLQAISIGLYVLAVFLIFHGQRFGGIALMLAPLALTSFQARGPWPRIKDTFTQVALYLFALEL